MVIGIYTYFAHFHVTINYKLLDNITSYVIYNYYLDLVKLLKKNFKVLKSLSST